ncbi:MAG: alpha/beta hydrolase [Gemmatimonadaceae bacterium]|nr:alpha/beta hydrolase [Chitinophagaceae bacterium]
MNKLLIAIICFLAACNNAADEKQPPPLAKLIVENNGVNIDFTESGSGDTTLLFIHGWNINKEYWDAQIDFFSNNYRVVAIDLPGFGKSGKNRGKWSVEEFGNDVQSVKKALNLKNVVLIGHSMSGAIIVETAIAHPEQIIAVVGIDNFQFVGYNWTAKDSADFKTIYKELETNYRVSVKEMAEKNLFSPSTDSAIKNRVIKDFVTADSALAVKALRACDTYPLDQRLTSLNKTLYLVNSNFRQTDTTGLIKLKIPFSLHEVGPTGHYPMIENAALFNAQLQEVLKEIRKLPQPPFSAH